MQYFDPCGSSQRFLFFQPICSHTLDFKINLLKEYDSWMLTDCDKSIPNCERAPAPWIKQTRPHNCLDNADLLWQSGELNSQWDYLTGRRFDIAALLKVTKHKSVMALRESVQGVANVGQIDWKINA